MKMKIINNLMFVLVYGLLFIGILGVLFLDNGWREIIYLLLTFLMLDILYKKVCGHNIKIAIKSERRKKK